MTKKNYILIANILKYHLQERTSFTGDSLPVMHSVIQDFAADLAKDNPRFNHDTFLKACGVCK